ncbi:MAG: c-type cytochrome [Cyanobacteria bacterium J06633_8]
MKKILSILLVAAAIFGFAFNSPALADGTQLFTANCAACHSGGKNLVNPQKTLQKETLEKYDMYSKEAITTQVNNGKAAMPAFKGRLSDAQISEVADYVLSQADAGWK